MIKLIAFITVQSILSVGGIMMLARVLHGKASDVRTIGAAVSSVEGLIGIVLLISSFIVMSFILSFAKASIYIPISTAIVFLTTVLFGVFFGSERVAPLAVCGMALIVVGVGLVSMRN